VSLPDAAWHQLEAVFTDLGMADDLGALQAE
jgi:hypothetical protein